MHAETKYKNRYNYMRGLHIQYKGVAIYNPGDNRGRASIIIVLIW